MAKSLNFSDDSKGLFRGLLQHTNNLRILFPDENMYT